MGADNAKCPRGAVTPGGVAPEQTLRRAGDATHTGGAPASSAFCSGAPTKGDTVSYRVHCNWCGKHLFREDRAVLEITVERRAAASRRERDWAQEQRPTLHFCVGENLDTNRMGMSDMRVDDPDSCFTRAIAAVNGRKTEPPNMGLEWRLVPVPGGPQERAPQPLTEEMRGLIDRLPVAYRVVLPKAGIHSVDQLAEMSDEEILALPRVGPGILAIIRTVIEGRNGREPETLKDEATKAISIEQLEIGVRTYNALKRAQIHNLLELCAHIQDRSIMAVPGLGPQGLDEIEHAIEKLTAKVLGERR